MRRGAVTLVAAPGETDRIRYGLVVRRSAGGAVVRNRIKRRLRHAIEQIPLEQGMDYLILADSEVAEVAFERLVAWLGDAQGALR